MVPFTPRLIGAVLPNLAHHVPMIQSNATKTNHQLLKVIQSLPPPDELGSRSPTSATATRPIAPPISSTVSNSSRTAAAGAMITRDGGPINRDRSVESLPESSATLPSKSRSNTLVPEGATLVTRTIASLDVASSVPIVVNDPLRSQSPTSMLSGPGGIASIPSQQHTVQHEENQPFDYSATVSALTVQFISEHEETRVAALKWLIMLHNKAPKHVCD
jgi:vacuole morphology and inheritance protein 14